MKANRKMIENNDAITSFLSIMIFTAITEMLVIIVWLFHSGIFSDAPKKLTPSIGLIQDGDHILITSVRNGPVLNRSVHADIINKSSGEPVGEASINDGGDGEVNTGDSIILTGINKGVFTVSIYYEAAVIGHCQYSIY